MDPIGGMIDGLTSIVKNNLSKKDTEKKDLDLKSITSFTEDIEKDLQEIQKDLEKGDSFFIKTMKAAIQAIDPRDVKSQEVFNKKMQASLNISAIKSSDIKVSKSDRIGAVVIANILESIKDTYSTHALAQATDFRIFSHDIIANFIETNKILSKISTTLPTLSAVPAVVDTKAEEKQGTKEERGLDQVTAVALFAGDATKSLEFTKSFKMLTEEVATLRDFDSEKISTVFGKLVDFSAEASEMIDKTTLDVSRIVDFEKSYVELVNATNTVTQAVESLKTPVIKFDFDAIKDFMTSYDSFLKSEGDVAVSLREQRQVSKTIAGSFEDIGKIFEAIDKVKTRPQLVVTGKAAFKGLDVWIKNLAKTSNTFKKHNAAIQDIKKTVKPIGQVAKSLNEISDSIEHSNGLGVKLWFKVKFTSFAWVKLWLKKIDEAFRPLSKQGATKKIAELIKPVRQVSESLLLISESINKSFFSLMKSNILWGSTTGRKDPFRGVVNFFTLAEESLSKNLPKNTKFKQMSKNLKEATTFVKSLSAFTMTLVAMSPVFILFGGLTRLLSGVVIKAIESTSEVINSMNSLIEEMNDLKPTSVLKATAACLLLIPFYVALTAAMFGTVIAGVLTLAFNAIGGPALLQEVKMVVTGIGEVITTAGTAIPLPVALLATASMFCTVVFMTALATALIPTIIASALSMAVIALGGGMTILTVVTSTFIPVAMMIGNPAVAVAAALGAVSAICLTVMFTALTVTMFAAALMCLPALVVAAAGAYTILPAVAIIAGVVFAVALIPLPVILLAAVNAVLLNLMMIPLTTAFIFAAIAAVVSIPIVVFSVPLLLATLTITMLTSLIASINPITVAFAAVNAVLLNVMMVPFCIALGLLFVASLLAAAVNATGAVFNFFWLTVMLNDFLYRLAFLTPALLIAIISTTLLSVWAALLIPALIMITLAGALAVTATLGLVALGAFFTGLSVLGLLSVGMIIAVVPLILFSLELWGLGAAMYKGISSILEAIELVQKYPEDYWKQGFKSFGAIIKGISEAMDNVGFFEALKDLAKLESLGTGMEKMLAAVRRLADLKIDDAEASVRKLGPIVSGVSEIADSISKGDMKDFAAAMENLSKATDPLRSVAYDLRKVGESLSGFNFDITNLKSFINQFARMDSNEIADFKKAGNNLSSALKTMPLKDLSSFADSYAKLNGKMGGVASDLGSASGSLKVDGLDKSADSVNNLSTSFGDLNQQIKELSENKETLELLQGLMGGESKDSSKKGIGGLISGLFNNDGKNKSAALSGGTTGAFIGTEKSLDDIYRVLDEINQKIAPNEKQSWATGKQSS